MTEPVICKGCGIIVSEINASGIIGVCDACLENHPAMQPVRDKINAEFTKERNKHLRRLKRDSRL